MTDEAPTMSRAALLRQGPIAVAVLPCLFAGAVLAGEGGGLVSRALEGLVTLAPLALVILVVSILVALGLARLSRRAAMPGYLTAGVLFLLTLSPSTPLLAAGAAWGFGLVVGREIFGREERTFVHAAVLGHVFLLVAWPQALGEAATWSAAPEGARVVEHLWLSPRPVALGASSAAAVAFAGVVLVVTRRIAWRPLLAVPVGAAVALALLTSMGSTAAAPRTLAEHMVLGGLGFGAVFFTGLRGSSPSAPSAQWFHGFLVGALVILLRLTVPAAPDGTISAVLLASVFAPLGDRIVRAGRASRFGRRDD